MTKTSADWTDASAASKYPGASDVYLMFPSAYYHYQEATARKMGSVDPKNDGPLDIQLATSRDGKTWNRLDRMPFIRLGGAGKFDSSYAYMVSGYLCRPAEICIARRQLCRRRIQHSSYSVFRPAVDAEFGCQRRRESAGGDPGRVRLSHGRVFGPRL